MKKAIIVGCALTALVLGTDKMFAEQVLHKVMPKPTSVAAKKVSAKLAPKQVLNPVAKKEIPQIIDKNLRFVTIDDFEDNQAKKPEWWKFDRLLMSYADNNPTEFSGLGKRSLVLEGSTLNWYIGGMGTYLGLDGTAFQGIRLVIFGNGPTSGVLKLELYDDDNGNWSVDTMPGKYTPTMDDVFSYKLPVDWTGWKVVDVPFYDFVDDNPEVGDNRFNPSQDNGSGGLLQLQIIALSAKKEVGKVDIKIDEIKLYGQQK